MNNQQHTIDQIRVDISGNDHGMVSKVQQQFSFELNTGSFLSQLETLFDNLVPAGEYLEIQTLEIAMNDFHENHLQEMLLHEIENRIRQKISSSSRNELKMMSRETFEKAIYTSFLRFGLLLYPSGQKVADRLHQELSQLPDRSSPIVESVLRDLGTKDPFVWKRLFFIVGSEGLLKYCQRVYQYSTQFLSGLLNAVHQDSGTATFSPHPQVSEPEFWQQLVPMLIDGWPEEKLKAEFFLTGETALLRGDLSKGKDKFVSCPIAISPLESWKPETGTSITHRDELIDIVNNGIPIANAGMVLLWMEFRQLIRKLGFVDGKNFLDTQRQQEAILLFHYIYSGYTDIREEELLLNKILCGWTLDEPIDPAYIPDQKTREAADKMLEDFVNDWRKERKYSVDWFRKSFLEREGILVKRTDGNWNLEIQKKTEDILITKISVVKYPWMQDMIFVNW